VPSGRRPAPSWGWRRHNEERVKAQSQGSQARVDGAQEPARQGGTRLAGTVPSRRRSDGVILKRSIAVGTLVDNQDGGFCFGRYQLDKAVFGVPG